MKIFSDTTLVLIGVVFMLLFFRRWDWEMVGVGTLISMFYVGLMVKVISPHVQWLDKIFIPERERQAAVSENAGTSDRHLVITIARMYGSGGDAVGEKVADSLGCPCCSRQIIDQTAVQMGYPEEFVAENEQNISTVRLWEMIFSDSGIPSSMNPSRDDAIFVSQSRAVLSIARKGPCVIVGRLGNWILRDRPNVLRVFIKSGKERAISRVTARTGLSEEEAAMKIDRVNTGRANHYWRYTGRQWMDMNEYDLVIDTDRTGIDGAAALIVRAAADFHI